MKELLLSNGELDRIGQHIKNSIKKKVELANANGAVVAVSGGVDSAVVLKLSSDVVDTFALILPEDGTTTRRDVRDAENLARDCGVGYVTIGINRILKSIDDSFPWKYFPGKNERLSRGNVKARARMILSYLVSNLDGRIVLGTGNKTELLMGYFTKFGDGASDMLPIGNLYKTQVRQLAEHIGITRKIIRKVPSAGLWRGQTDESELGMSYGVLDRILFHIVERRLKPETVARRVNVKPEKVTAVVDRMSKNRHKRMMSRAVAV